MQTLKWALLGIGSVGAALVAVTLLRARINRGRGLWYWNPHLNFKVGVAGGALMLISLLVGLPASAFVNHDFVLALCVTVIGALGILNCLLSIVIVMDGPELESRSSEHNKALAKFVPLGSTWQEATIKQAAIGVALTAWALIVVFAPPIAGFLACVAGMVALAVRLVYLLVRTATGIQRLDALFFLGASLIPALETMYAYQPFWGSGWRGWVFSADVCIIVLVILVVFGLQFRDRRRNRTAAI